jgi:hypothetical protein
VVFGVECLLSLGVEEDDIIGVGLMGLSAWEIVPWRERGESSAVMESSHMMSIVNRYSHGGNRFQYLSHWRRKHEVQLPGSYSHVPHDAAKTEPSSRATINVQRPLPVLDSST